MSSILQGIHISSPTRSVVCNDLASQFYCTGGKSGVPLFDTRFSLTSSLKS